MRLLRIAILLFVGAATAVSAQTPSRNVIVVTLDGFRWQEMFGGADEAYFKRDRKGVLESVAAKYLAPTADARRAVRMPFMWKTVAAKGQIFGDPSQRSVSHLTNGMWFSYPGYNELLTGAADPRVDSNDKKPNPNITVLEWLNGRPGFAGKVAAFGAWDVLPYILNTERSHLPVGSAFTPVVAPTTPRGRELNQLAADLPAYWSYGSVDAPFVYAAIDAMQTHAPRVIYIMLGETDEWAHENKYAQYLDAATRADRFIERLWTTAQSLPAYKDSTTILLTTDHGRGATTKDWSDHGKDVPAAENTWMAAIGPSVPALGVRKDLTVTTSQFAATIAAVLGQDFRAASPKTAPALPLSVR